MATSAEGFGVDTSVAVPALDAGHATHSACRSAILEHRPALAGHAAFETFAVLTRMPSGPRLDSTTAGELIEAVFDRVVLSADQQRDLLERLGPMGVHGGSVYDALVAEAARSNELTLLTRDRRAMPTYDLVGVRYRLID